MEEKKTQHHQSTKRRSNRIVTGITSLGVTILDAEIESGQTLLSWLKVDDEVDESLIDKRYHRYRQYKVSLNNDTLETIYVFTSKDQNMFTSKDVSIIKISEKGNITCHMVTPYEVYIAFHNWVNKTQIRRKIKRDKEKETISLDPRLELLLGKKIKTRIIPKRELTIKYKPDGKDKTALAVDISFISGKWRLKFQSYTRIKEKSLNSLVHKYFPSINTSPCFTPGLIHTYIYTLD